MTRKQVLRKMRAAERAAEKAGTAAGEAHMAILKYWKSERQLFFMSQDFSWSAGLTLSMAQTLRRTLDDDVDSPQI